MPVVKQFASPVAGEGLPNSAREFRQSAAPPRDGWIAVAVGGLTGLFSSVRRIYRVRKTNPHGTENTQPHGIRGIPAGAAQEGLINVHGVIVF